MTDQELQRLAKEYAKELFPEHYALMQKGECDFETEEVIKGCISAFESHVHYLMQDFCIVSREKVEEQYMRAEKWLTETDNPKQHHDPIRLIAVGSQSTLESIFGTELFEERSEK